MGLDPAARLSAVVQSINERHGDADLCVITGDLADDGDRTSYELLKAILAPLAMPCRLQLGNHDRRAPFRAVFLDTPVDDAGFVQSTIDVPEMGRLIFSDTLVEGGSQGHLCADRLSWLERSLAQASDVPALVFMHHPPLAMGIRHFEGMALEEPDPFFKLLRGHPAGVRHIFFGHVHLAVSGSWGGIPYSAHPGSCHHMILDLPNPDATFALARPNYAVVLIERDTITVHNEASLAGANIIGHWPPRPEPAAAPVAVR